MRNSITAFYISLLLTGTLAAQLQFATIPQPWLANGGGAVGGGIYFDLSVRGGVSISRLDCNLGSTAGTVGSIDVYTIAGSHRGMEFVPSAWTLAGTAACIAAGRDVPTPCTFAAPVQLPPGSYGVAICVNGVAHAYSNGNGANQSFSDPNLTSNHGAATNLCFGPAGLFVPRVWNGVIHYTTISNFASATPYGSGCSGIALSSQRPVEGSTMRVTVTNLPVGTGLGTLVLSPTRIDPGIQPFPGLASCFQHVALDDVVYFVPSGSSHLLQLAVPVGTLTGALVHAQAITFSPGINPLGVGSSNGLAWTIDIN